MKVLFPVIMFSLIMAYISERRSVYEIDEYASKKYIFKEKLFWFLMAVGMAVF